ncbi:MAG: AraC family transcriptional regulator [Lachnospiraceae bacterium]|nr:AraC family transcriptional regulator [uncultured Acetatifactor sp.]MCI8544080.1 AraC family transcriptional regulator [Lachnospiraceae bacterium]
MATQSLIKIHKYHDDLQRFIHFYNVKRDKNLILIQTGCQDRCHSVQVRPRVRDHFLLHFVSAGSGCLHLQNASYKVNANDCFLIYPNELSTYHSQTGSIWAYYWIGISGTLAEDLLAKIGFRPGKQAIHFSDPSVFDVLAQIVDVAMLYQDDIYALYMKTCSLLYQLFSILYLENKEKRLTFHSPLLEDNAALFGIGYSRQQWVSAVVTLIQDNYSENLKVEAIASYLHLNRSYLSSLFKQEMGVSIKQYLSEYRIEAARNKLLKTDRSISEISYQCGFPDPLYFSRIFKEKTGLSPSEFRQADNSEGHTSGHELDKASTIDLPAQTEDYFLTY